MGMGFAKAAAAAAKSSGESLKNGARMVAAASRNASASAKKANPNLKKVKGKKKSRFKSMAKKMSAIPMGRGMATNGGY